LEEKSWEKWGEERVALKADEKTLGTEEIFLFLFCKCGMLHERKIQYVQVM
jgi:hypothetical protein